MEGVEAHWCLTAILEVIKKCNTHKEAAEWFNTKKISIPSNCIVEGNLPLDNKLTGYECFDEVKYGIRATEYTT